MVMIRSTVDRSNPEPRMIPNSERSAFGNCATPKMSSTICKTGVNTMVTTMNHSKHENLG